jgi:hypothetical protein
MNLPLTLVGAILFLSCRTGFTATAIRDIKPLPLRDFEAVEGKKGCSAIPYEQLRLKCEATQRRIKFCVDPDIKKAQEIRRRDNVLTTELKNKLDKDISRIKKELEKAVQARQQSVIVAKKDSLKKLEDDRAKLLAAERAHDRALRSAVSQFLAEFEDCLKAREEQEKNFAEAHKLLDLSAGFPSDPPQHLTRALYIVKPIIKHMEDEVAGHKEQVAEWHNKKKNWEDLIKYLDQNPLP